ESTAVTGPNLHLLTVYAKLTHSYCALEDRESARKVAMAAHNMVAKYRTQLEKNADTDELFTYLTLLLTIEKEAFGNDSLQAAQILNMTASYCLSKADFASAERYLSESISILDRPKPELQDGLCWSLMNMTTVYCNTARQRQAEAIAKKVVAIREQT